MSQPSAEERIVQYRPLIKSRARNWWRGPTAKLSTLEELEAVATAAVWAAAETYRDDRGATFGTYVYNCVDHALARVAKDARRLKRQGCTVSIELGPDDEVPVLLVAQDSNPELQCNALEVRRIVRAAVDTLPARQRDIIERRFWRDETLEAIGIDYSLTRERIRQLEAQAFDRLRPQLAPLWNGMPQEAA